MATTVTRSVEARNAAGDAVVDLLDVNAPGKMIIMEADDTVLSEHALSNPAFGDTTNGVATAAAIADDTSANASGTAALAKFEDGNALEVFRCSVGEAGSGAGVIVNSTNFVAGTKISVASVTYTVPNP